MYKENIASHDNSLRHTGSLYSLSRDGTDCPIGLILVFSFITPEYRKSGKFRSRFNFVSEYNYENKFFIKRKIIMYE